MFLLKKVVSLFLAPFPIFLFLLGIGLYFLYRGHIKLAKRWIIGSLIWISLLSYSPFSSLLIEPLENRYSKVKLDRAPVHYIHVLGSGHVTNEKIPLSSQLGLVSLARVNEGVSIYKSHPNMKLIFSGYGGYQYDEPNSNALMNAKMALALGVQNEDIILLESPKDTHEEAIAAQKIVGEKPVILITSASHMLRASSLFEKAGVKVIPAPTDFQVKRKEDLWQFPSADGLARSEAAFHEYLGLAWSLLKGYI